MPNSIPVDDDLYLSVGNQLVSGWTDIRVTRGIERCPSDFEIGLTERSPEQLSDIVVRAGAPVQVSLGRDLVITGYVDEFIPSFAPEEHAIRVTGRGKCQDLVDCSAVWPNGQISGTSAVDIATKLASHYGIKVNCDVTDLVTIPQFNIFIGETSFEVIERVSRYSQLLVYDQPDGNLRLAQAEKQATAAGGLAEGFNVQAASIRNSAHERFSRYKAFAQTVATFGDAGVGPSMIASVTDDEVNRVRERYIVAEAVQGFADIAKRRTIWEMHRRIGRSHVVTIVTDSWRDADGVLWEPNTLVNISLPHLGLQNETWLIGEVTYRRTIESGTTAELTIMDPRAFEPEPIALQPTFVDGAVFGTR
ncbi:phage baseplate assembly protein [Burkholderia vietnamiensis]|uniref:phage baseplate assembly protein n=1 Tax=Burkholderia vietnamiensis TaxID=60552 RepID=UPI0015910967|nr:Mu P family protein [Burkholderia vietnamiensis]